MGRSTGVPHSQPPLTLLFVFSFKKFSFYLFIYGCAGSSLLCRPFSGRGDQGLLLIVVRGLLITVASLEHRPLVTLASVVVVHRFRCSVACGIFLG